MTISLFQRISYLAALLSIGSVASANLFTNEGFDTGDFTGWDVSLTPNGHTDIQAVTVFPTVLGVPSNAATFAVGRSITGFGTEPEGVMLTQSLFLLGGVEYDIHFDIAADNQSGPNAQAGIFTAIVDGASVGFPTEPGNINLGETLRGQVTGTFTPNVDGNYDVGIRVTRVFLFVPGLQQYVDNASVAAVPEPASIIALGAGLLALARRRRNK